MTPTTRAARVPARRPVGAVGRRLRGADRTRGAAAVEAAIVLPVVLLILFAVIEFGLLFKDWLAISSGVRSGARTASAEPLANTNATFAVDAAKQVALSMDAVRVAGTPRLYVYDPDTTPDPKAACVTRCLSFSWNAGAQSFGVPTGVWKVCGLDATARDKLGVELVVNHASVTGIGFATIPITERAVMAFEPTSDVATCS